LHQDLANYNNLFPAKSIQKEPHLANEKRILLRVPQEGLIIISDMQTG
jgi:hypothetical protein